MYIFAQNKHRSISVPVTNADISVISTGNMTNSNATDIVHLRPDGLPNYLLIYIEKGTGVFSFNGKTEYAHAGDIAVYRPNEPQSFTYMKEEPLHAYWIHFHGTEADSIMERYHLKNIQVTNCKNEYISKYIKDIVYEINKSSIYSSDIADNLLMVMLAKIAQQLYNNSTKSNIEDIKNFIWQNYTKEIPIAQYAEKCRMSVPNFMRVFKQQTGTTPHDYKLRVRIHCSKELLLTTDSTILDISGMVGFNDQFYFSRYFKKLTGLSPSEYRTKYKNSDRHEEFEI